MVLFLLKKNIMQIVYREIVNVVDHRLNLLLPNHINTDKVEVIIIPLNKSVESDSKVDFRKYFGLSNVDYPVIDNYLEEIREEWDRKITY